MAREIIRVVSAVIEQDGKYLLTQRTESAVFPLLWEFPGGRVEPGEGESSALIREVRGRLGIDVLVVEKIGERIHEYEAYNVHLSLYACALPQGLEPRADGVNDLRWVSSSELENYEFPPADQKSMAELLDISLIH